MIRGYFGTSVATAELMAILRLKFLSLSQPKSEISNFKRRFRQETLIFMTNMAAVLLCIKNSFFTKYTVDDDSYLHQLSLAYPKSIELYIKFNGIPIFDCTYKANRHGKPLFKICGVTRSNEKI